MPSTPLPAAYTAIVTAIAGCYQARQQRRQQALGHLLPALTGLAQAQREQHRLESPHLNTFRFFNPGETTHSRLLAFLLDPRAAHGQGPLFLREFLRQLGIEDTAGSLAAPWVVTAEVGRVDVLLRRAQPHAVVILENKSNYAIDQPHQLYRYWHQHIYLRQLAQHCPAQELLDPPRDRYRLVYLAPTRGKHAERQSLCQPPEWAAEAWGAALPTTVPPGIVEHHTFPDLVVAWLTSAVARLPPGNHRLREFTLQYLQFWQLS